MIDPITALATATAIFNGIKKAVEVGREAEDVFIQLSKWAGAVSDVQEYLAQADKPVPLFRKLAFQDDTKAAFDAYAAKIKLQQMEKDIYEMFHYGELQHLGRDGYMELIHMRREIKAKREKMIYEQVRRRKEFLDQMGNWAVGSMLISFCLVLLWGTAALIMEHAK